MSSRLKAVFFTLMSLAMLFGFMHLFINSHYNFERLHIFLFNLCSGGTIILYYTEQKKHPSLRTITFLILSITYALLTFFEHYIPAMIVALVLAIIVDSIRTKNFSFFPHDFFRGDVPVYRKFHQASLLCLSMGLVISSLVILNNVYLKIINLPKFKLDTFFLGFSFPLSLITMSVMFSLIRPDFGRLVKLLKNLGFWVVNLGVISFFVFILLEMETPQLIISSILSACVIMIFFLYKMIGIEEQQKNFLTSGMGFLLCTAVTGMLYIILHMMPGYNASRGHFVLRVHAFVSLYGWNLSGLAVICRYNDFPIRLHSKYVIWLHWITVLILAPIGYYSRPVALVTVACYCLLLYLILFSEGSGQMEALVHGDMRRQ